ncbi:3-deoxy-D-manno-octulosonic acid transferase [Marnyiella aurantia]|uniref:3-deoxy-D-manno-octulosonic acid transferase n=1 Tax=Marnyiella aurantia TaxID=2758037 RepID=UPI001FD859C4|nr:glycosyltransferase N-terminal domain-containing protein [Marnyiella aurantia]
MKVGAVFSYKLKKGLAGRRQSCDIVKAAFSPTDRVIWMHAASLGEYEQGIPVLEKLKEKFPQHKILITFFSPSGYDNVIHKNHIADAVCYLPFDTPRWVQLFTSNFTTGIFVTVKYEYWYNLLAHLNSKGAKIYVISAFFYERQVFFKPYGSWFVNEIRKNVTWFFHQTPTSYGLAKTLRLNQSSIAGDTRFDRVKQIRERDSHVPFVERFKNGHQLVVFGSCWETEEQIALLLAYHEPQTKIIIAPHDLARTEILKDLFPNAVLYSQLDAGKPLPMGAQVLIIDCIGLLSKLYSYADVAVVGGGFHSKGLHNILEAATFAVPVLFGNKYTKNPEADQLMVLHGGKSFDNETQASEFLLRLLRDSELLGEMGQKAGSFVADQPDATRIILEKILA